MEDTKQTPAPRKGNGWDTVKSYLNLYFVDAMSAMAQGLFASLLIGTIISTIGTQLGVPLLTDIGNFAKAMSGPAMAVAIGYALKAPPLGLPWRQGAAQPTPWAGTAALWRFWCWPSLPQSWASW